MVRIMHLDEALASDNPQHPASNYLDLMRVRYSPTNQSNDRWEHELAGDDAAKPANAVCMIVWVGGRGCGLSGQTRR